MSEVNTTEPGLNYYWRQSVPGEDLEKAIRRRLFNFTFAGGFSGEGIAAVKFHFVNMKNNKPFMDEFTWGFPINKDEVTEEEQKHLVAEWSHFYEKCVNIPGRDCYRTNDMCYATKPIHQDGHLDDLPPVIECLLWLKGFDVVRIMGDLPEELDALWAEGQFSQVFYSA